MVIAALVIIYYALLDTFGSNFYSNMDNPVLASVCRQDPKLYGIECISRISARHIRQKVQSFLIDLCMKAAHAFLRVFHRPFQKDLYIFLFQRFQLKDAGSGDQRAVYFKIRVLRSRTDQDHSAILYKWKQIILLAFVEPVNLVDKENRLPAVHALQVFRLFYNFLHILFSCHRGIDLLELRAGRIGDHPCQCGLPSARRSVKDDGA